MVCINQTLRGFIRVKQTDIKLKKEEQIFIDQNDESQRPDYIAVITDATNTQITDYISLFGRKLTEAANNVNKKRQTRCCIKCINE